MITKKNVFLISVIGGLFVLFILVWGDQVIPPTSLSIGLLNIHLYSLFFALALLFGYIIARSYIASKKMDLYDFDLMILLAVVFGIVGARLFFVAGHWPYYENNLLEVFKFWQGGMAFYGGLLGGFLGIVISNYFLKVKFWVVVDGLALGLALGQAIGRWGNYFNQEAFGQPTSSFYKILISPTNRPIEFIDNKYFQPTFLFESFLLLILFFLLVWLVKTKNPPTGLLFGIYAFASGSFRFLIEFLRVDALVVSGLKISQLTAIVFILIGVYIIYKKYDHSWQN